jgi:hypothetical protein
MIGCRCKAAVEMSLSLFSSSHLTLMSRADWVHTIHSMQAQMQIAEAVSQQRCISFTHSHTRAPRYCLTVGVSGAEEKCSVIRAQQRVRHDCQTTLTEWEPRREWPTDCYYYFNKQCLLTLPAPSKQSPPEWGWTLAAAQQCMHWKYSAQASKIGRYSRLSNLQPIEFIGD